MRFWGKKQTNWKGNRLGQKLNILICNSRYGITSKKLQNTSSGGESDNSSNQAPHERDSPDLTAPAYPVGFALTYTSWMALFPGAGVVLISKLPNEWINGVSFW